MFFIIVPPFKQWTCSETEVCEQLYYSIALRNRKARAGGGTRQRRHAPVVLLTYTFTAGTFIL
jgi:hypothetical protein